MWHYHISELTLLKGANFNDTKVTKISNYFVGVRKTHVINITLVVLYHFPLCLLNHDDFDIRKMAILVVNVIFLSSAYKVVFYWCSSAMKSLLNKYTLHICLWYLSNADILQCEMVRMCWFSLSLCVLAKVLLYRPICLHPGTAYRVYHRVPVPRRQLHPGGCPRHHNEPLLKKSCCNDP